MAVTTVFAAAGIALAAPAAADLTAGDYTATTIDGNTYESGATDTMTFTPCGENCLMAVDHEYHLQGNTWSTTDDKCSVTIDNTSLIMRIDCGPANDVSQLTRNG